MSRMQELYEKVSKDAALQEKLSVIMKDAEKVGEEATKEKLVMFAKDAGHNVTMDEMQAFFIDFLKTKEDELSEQELDAVAGGKHQVGLTITFLTAGIGCVAISIVEGMGGCARILSSDF